MPVTVYTVGGGVYIVQIFNAVAAWTHGGGYIGFLEAVSMMAFIYAIVLAVFNISFMALWRWFLTSTIIYAVFMVPTESVMVIDPVNPNFGQQVVANVPLGLAEMAGVSSEIGEWLTTTAEALFNVPDNQQYNQNGLIYGARLMDQVQAAQIDRAGLSYDVDNYIRNCVFYDVLLSNTNLSTIANSTNIWASLASTNIALQTNVIPLDNDGNQTGPGQLQSCQQAYQTITGYWTSYLTNYSSRFAGMTFPQILGNGNPGNAYAQQKLAQDLPSVYQSITNNSSTAVDVLQQALATNAFIEARANAAGSPNMSNVDAFAQARSDVQAGYTYNTIAEGARKWVPILNIVLTVVFYGMFPVIFPLFLLPETGMGVLKGYFTGFFYLASWGPLYAVLNMITVMQFTSKGLAAANGGMTLQNGAALQAVGSDVSEVAGYMLAFVPFIAAGMASGARTIGSNATSMLAPSQNAAEQAAGEAATGNYSYGNVSYENMQSQNVTALQRQMQPSLTYGAPRMTEVANDGASLTHYSGRDVYDYTGSVSRYPTSVSIGESLAERSDREAKVLSNQATDVSNFQRQVQDWSTARVHSAGGSNTTVDGTSTSQTDNKTKGTSDYSSNATATGQSNTTSQQTTNSDASGTRLGLGADGGAHIGSPSGGAGNGAGGGGILGLVSARFGGHASADKYRDTATTQSGSFTHSNDLKISSDSGTRKNNDTSFVNSDGSYNRVDASDFKSWSDEQRDTYVKSIGNEERRLQGASKSYSESASSMRSNTASIDYNANRDLESYFQNSSDLRGFAGGGLQLLRKTRGEMSGTERMAYDKAMDDFMGSEAAKQATLFAQGQAQVDHKYVELQVGLK